MMREKSPSCNVTKQEMNAIKVQCTFGGTAWRAQQRCVPRWSKYGDRHSLMILVPRRNCVRSSTFFVLVSNDACVQHHRTSCLLNPVRKMSQRTKGTLVGLVAEYNSGSDDEDIQSFPSQSSKVDDTLSRTPKQNSHQVSLHDCTSIALDLA